MLLVTACSGGERREGALTADEDRQLNEAAEMLDKSADTLPAENTVSGEKK